MSTCRVESCLKKTRSFLKVNKIFLDFLSVIFIGLASLVVSYSALDVSNKLLGVSEISIMPHFIIGTRYKIDSESQKYVEDTLFLNNVGAPISNLKWETATFLVLQGGGMEHNYVFIPLNGYYSGQVLTSNVMGELSTKIGYLNRDKFSALYGEMMAQNRLRDLEGHYFMQVMTFSKVGYEDRLGRRAAVYFKAYAKISEATAMPFFEANSNGLMLELGRALFSDVLSSSKAKSALVFSEIP